MLVQLSEDHVKELKSKPLELFAIARYMYRIGHPIMTDPYYDSLEKFIRSKAPELPIVNRTYDDDPVPKELITKYVGDKYLVNYASSKWRDIIKDGKSLSIQPYTDLKKVHEGLLNFNGKDVFLSLKKDGVNSEDLYSRLSEDSNVEEYNTHNLMCMLSRGRKGERREYPNLRKSIPQTIKGLSNMPDILTVRGEALVTYEGMDILREECKHMNANFVTPKSSALSMLTTRYPDKYYKYLKFYAFYCPGLADTVSGTYEKLQDLGFTVPEHKLIPKLNVPENYTEFLEWFTPIMDEMWEISRQSGTKSDGVVIELNDLTQTSEINGQYSNRNMALKVLHWSGKVYRSKLIGYKSEQQRIKCSCIGLIEPVDTGDGTCTDVNLYNASIAINNGAKIGSYIYFVRKSETVSVFVYGKELEKILSEAGNELNEEGNIQLDS